jgi:hypothetical protein
LSFAGKLTEARIERGAVTITRIYLPLAGDKGFSCIYEGNARVSAWKSQERGSRCSALAEMFSSLVPLPLSCKS